MTARAMRADEVGDDEMLDADTSAAILRWMETGLVPEGITEEQWSRWADGGCREAIHVDGVPVMPEMLGRWASTGTLR